MLQAPCQVPQFISDIFTNLSRQSAVCLSLVYISSEGFLRALTMSIQQHIDGISASWSLTFVLLSISKRCIFRAHGDVTSSGENIPERPLRQHVVIHFWPLAGLAPFGKVRKRCTQIAALKATESPCTSMASCPYCVNAFLVVYGRLSDFEFSHRSLDAAIAYGTLLLRGTERRRQ